MKIAIQKFAISKNIFKYVTLFVVRKVIANFVISNRTSYLFLYIQKELTFTNTVLQDLVGLPLTVLTLFKYFRYIGRSIK